MPQVELIVLKMTSNYTPSPIIFSNFVIILYFTFTLCEKLDAQIVSHELRRLAVSTNQFGIDVLKSLDRVEPPDKVLVFSPVCLSSSLMMIMMGSSKYQVVSSLRHALYVWSMKPAEINRGFKDIFEHIGFNQQQQEKKNRIQSATFERRSRSIHAPQFNDLIDVQHTMQHNRVNQSPRMSSEEPNRSSSYWYYSSLPNLIRMREILERSLINSERSWWHTMNRRSDTSSNSSQQIGQSSSNFDQIYSNGTDKLIQRELGDMSQMNALSSIYIQRGLSMNYNYNLLLRQYYKTVIHPVDFTRNAEETRQHINSLVAVNTEGKIKDLVKKGSFNTRSAPKVMMISTFHFRGTLDIEMKSKNQNSIPKFGSTTRASRSSDRNNQTDKGDNVIRQQMKTKSPLFIETEPTLLKYGHFKNLDCSVIEIPFSNRLVTLIIVMPNHHNSTEMLLTKLSAQVLSDLVNSLAVRKLSIEIPVIKFDRGPVNVEGVMRELGLDNIFFGDKTYSTETGLNRWLRPSDIVHETSIDIGTINPNWAQTEDRLKVGAHDSRTSESEHIKLDRSFLYFVMDSINSLILTMGRIRQ